VENIIVEDCDFDSGHGMVTCGSEATIVRRLRVRNCRVGADVPIVRLKLRPDTPQLYEDFVFDGIVAKDAQSIFDVKPWTQFFDLAGHEPPKSIVRGVLVRNITGSFRTLGELRGNDGGEIADVVLENIDVTAADAHLKVDGERAVRFHNVKVNGALLNKP
jgi:alpha-L-rhamnosidase